MATAEEVIELDNLRGDERNERDDLREETSFIDREDDSDKILTKSKDKFDFSAGNKKFDLTSSEEKTSTPLKGILNKSNRDDTKKYFPNMSNDVEIVSLADGRLSAKLFGSKKNFTPLFTKKGEYNKNIKGDLKDALGSNRDEIIKRNNEENSRDEKRIGVLKESSEKPDISNETKEKINDNISKLNEKIDERNQENEAIKSKKSMQERIKEVFKEHGFTAFSVLTSVGVVIGVIVSNLKSGLAAVAKGLGNGLKALGKKLAQILPGMIGAIASFIFKTAGDALGFLAKNSWLLILFIVTYAVEQYTGKKK